ncbi:MAG: Na+/H+ antiporter NhaC [Lachnospiraceae bacterium]|nr:Na+/H+ antiporter NhaC [Lachnospiraceae bacterium]
MKKNQTNRYPSVGYAAFFMSVLAVSTFVGYKLLGASLNTIMFINWIVMTLCSIPLGYNYEQMEKKALESVGNIMGTFMLMLAIGALAGTWMASGTVPAVMYYGMNILSAKFFLPAALVLCSIVSLATGTSWGTFATMGIALLGIGNGLGIPAGMTAGAAICGSWFGDKISPLSDTTNFTSAVVGADLFTHIRHMMYTTGPSYILSFILFTVLSQRVSSSAVMDTSLIQSTQSGILAAYKLGLPVLLPVVLVFVLLILRKNPTMTLLLGAIAGAAVAVLYQGFTPAAAFGSFWNGFEGTFENEFLTSLLNRGGVSSMLSTAMTMLLCCGIGGMLKEMRVVHVIVGALSKLIRSTFSLVLISEIIAYVAQMLSGSHYFSDVILQSTMLDMFREKRLKPENLSRIMEDCNTIGGVLIPWSSTGLYVVATLGVPFVEYIPYVFLCYLTPLMGLICALTGWGMARYAADEEIPE